MSGVATFAARTDSQQPSIRSRTGAALWICTVQFFVVEAVVQSRWTAPYDRMTNNISDLGAVHCTQRAGSPAVCSPWHAAMNTSFILQGVLIASGAVLLRPFWPRPSAVPLPWIATASLVTAGGGVALVGLAPEDTVRTVHVLGAAANFVAGNAGLVLLWVSGRRAREPRTAAAAVWSGLLGALGLTALASLALGANWGLGPGGIERVVAYPLPAALPVVGTAVLLSGRSRARLSRRPD